MKALVTYKKNSWCNEIAEQLGEIFDDFHYIYANNGDLELVNKDEEIKRRYDTMIRFGTYANYLPNANKVYNYYEGVKTTSNKLKARRLFKENHVPTPKTYSARELQRDYRNNEDITLPLIRRTKSHHGGQNLKVIETLADLENEYYNEISERYYYSEHYPKQQEFRVHVASGKAIIVAEKVVEEDKKDNVIWNLNDNGVCNEFRTLRWSEYHDIEEVIQVASLATKAVGLDYGAVDIVAYPKTRKDELPPVAVLEVNSAPRLEEYGISRYVQYFKWLFLHETERAEFKLPHTLDRFSFTNDDFDLEYIRLERENSRSEDRVNQPEYEPEFENDIPRSVLEELSESIMW